VTELLRIDDLYVSYGKVDALRGVSLRVTAKSIVTIVGANGAGKSTCLNAIAGLLPSRGATRLDGILIDELEVEERLVQGVSLVPERAELFSGLSVAANLRLGGFSCRRNRRELQRRLDSVYDRFPRLAERREQLAATLSGGERRMLAIGRALMSGPRLLLLDEPSLGLAPLIVQSIFEMFKVLRADGLSILLVEQNARAALEVADYGYVLETGEVVLEDFAIALLQNTRLASTYLGPA
jgi:branched-chain amino acid transport system ATP-binding protein